MLVPSSLPILRLPSVGLGVLVSGEVVLANERDRGAVHDVKVNISGGYTRSLNLKEFSIGPEMAELQANKVC